MRQAGVIAAAGIVALETMIERLAEDHANARVGWWIGSDPGYQTGSGKSDDQYCDVSICRHSLS